MEIEISFPGGMSVQANFGEHVIRTDQSRDVGGGGSAPEPFMLFLSSIGTCAGIYALRFCQSRGLPTDGLGITERAEWDDAAHRLSRIELLVRLPAGFPEKYREALVRAVDQCTVKRTILDPPAFMLATSSARE